MRSSFYSEKEEETQIVDTFKLSNVLELNSKEQEILAEIKRIMQEECESLTMDIEDL